MTNDVERWAPTNRAELIAELAAEREKCANLELALRASRRIGVAIGILMERYKISDNDAFGILSQASQHRNIKLRDLADRVVHTGSL